MTLFLFCLAKYDKLKVLYGYCLAKITAMFTLPLTLDLKTVHLSDEQFYQLAIANPNLRMERTAAGDLILMTPVGGYSSNQELELGADLAIWNRQSQLGKVFSSSTIFQLPGGGVRARGGGASSLPTKLSGEEVPARI